MTHRELIDRYHALLTPEVAEETHAYIESQLQRRGLVFGGRALCTVLRPRLSTPQEIDALQKRIRPLMSAFATAYDRAVREVAFRAQFGLLEWEETLFAADNGYGLPSPTSRLDFFYVPETGALKLTEYNAETPAGAGYIDALSDTFVDTRAMRAFSREFEVFALPCAPGVVGALLDAYRAFSRGGNKPRVAILDWDDVPTRTEFELFAEHFRKLGLDCIIEDPRRCEYRGGKLWAGGKPMDLIYKRVLITELVETCGIESDVVRAVRDGAVCMVDGFRCKVLHKKASLAVLSDENNASMFSSAERAAIADCIPWTRVVREARSTYGGTAIDLVPFIAKERERLVLKPSDEYGGKGITLGWTVDDAEWERAMREALASPYIVQERVDIPSESYPSWVDGRVEMMDRMIDTAPFVTHGAYMEGVLTRMSTAKLLNVTAGGGSTVPTFVVQPR